MGSAGSKLVVSLVLEDAAKASDFPATVIRAGQIAGSESETHVGIWNKHELIPFVIASSLYHKALPKDIAQKNSVDWMSVGKMNESHF